MMNHHCAGNAHFYNSTYCTTCTYSSTTLSAKKFKAQHYHDFFPCVKCDIVLNATNSLEVRLFEYAPVYKFRFCTGTHFWVYLTISSAINYSFNANAIACYLILFKTPSYSKHHHLLRH